MRTYERTDHRLGCGMATEDLPYAMEISGDGFGDGGDTEYGDGPASYSDGNGKGRTMLRHAHREFATTIEMICIILLR